MLFGLKGLEALKNPDDDDACFKVTVMTEAATQGDAHNKCHSTYMRKTHRIEMMLYSCTCEAK